MKLITVPNSDQFNKESLQIIKWIDLQGFFLVIAAA